MRSRNRIKAKGRSESGGFIAIPHAVQDSANWRQCSATAIKLLCDMARQFNGRNNGDLTGALSVLRKRGWSSPDTITWALRELRHYGLLQLTRQGGLHGASLYALTWKPIDDCGGKLDCGPTNVATGAWREAVPRFRRPPKSRKSATPSVAGRYAIRSSKPERPP